jgi:hypothetical protein
MNHPSKKAAVTLPLVRCAVYTRKSTEEGLEQEFNSLDAQRESAEAFIRSQTHEGWTCLPDRYDAGEAAVIVAAGQTVPAFGPLAGHEGLAGLTLSIQGVKFLLQTFFRRFARVDGAAH